MRFAALLAIGVALAGCATLPNEHLKAGQALSVATTSLDAAAKAADAMVVAGITTRAENVTIAKVAPEARDLINAASKAYSANQDATAEQNAYQVSALAAQILAIVESHK